MIPEIVKVARRFGFNAKGNSKEGYSCNCPFHKPKDTEASLIFGKDRFSWFFKCWKCGARGRDDVDFRKFLKGSTAAKEAKDGQLKAG